MTERQNRTYESMGPEQRAAIDRMRKRVATSEARSEAAQVRDLVEMEIPPKRLPIESAALTTLRGERERRGLSLMDLSERTGIERSALSKLERGESNPTLLTLERYAAGLGMQIHWELIDRGATLG